MHISVANLLGEYDVVHFVMSFVFFVAFNSSFVSIFASQLMPLYSYLFYVNYRFLVIFSNFIFEVGEWYHIII